MKSTRLFILTSLAMMAFASNSLLCRLALKHTAIDAATFTFVRILSGAVALWFILEVRTQLRTERTASLLFEASSGSPRVSRHSSRKSGNWLSALALFVYAAAFSFAYVDLSVGTGALLLFGAVQASMILWGFRKGERLDAIQVVGFVAAALGLVVLVFPGLSAPPLGGSILMLGAGVAWGIYSVRGKGVQNPASVTAGNFVRAVPFSAVVWIIFLRWTQVDSAGITFAVISGAIASGLGYVIWYSAVSSLKATSAATIQLSVPVLAAAGGILLLGEPITLRYLFASVAVLGGIALVIWERSHAKVT
jgi:drug/metabolite transporter (DMT)-like permease